MPGWSVRTGGTLEGGGDRENCIFASFRYSISHGRPRSVLGRAPHLFRRHARGLAVGRRAPAEAHAADGRPHIDALEAALGVSLFTRSPRGLVPTAAATALVPYGEAMTAAAGALVRSAASHDDVERGIVRITASQVVSAEVLPPILAAFAAEHPGIAIELAVTNRNEDLARGEADIAVRMVRPTQSGLVAKKIGAVSIGLFAHRDYCRRFGEPSSLEDLRRHRIIGFDRDSEILRFVGPLAGALTREAFLFRCDNDLVQLAALRAGVGVGGCQAPIARRDEDLVPVLPGAFAVPLEIWLVTHRDRKTNRRVRLAHEALAAGLGDYVRSLGRDRPLRRARAHSESPVTQGE